MIGDSKQTKTERIAKLEAEVADLRAMLLTLQNQRLPYTTWYPQLSYTTSTWPVDIVFT